MSVVDFFSLGSLPGNHTLMVRVTDGERFRKGKVIGDLSTSEITHGGRCISLRPVIVLSKVDSSMVGSLKRNRRISTPRVM